MEHTLSVAHWGEVAATANSAFLLAFPSLFSIINPIGGALIFYGFTKDFSSDDRLKVAASVGFYSLLVMFGALWAGAYVLSFFGVSLDALRIAGGMVIALSGFQLLTSSEPHPDQKSHERARIDASASDPMQLAFFPLTLPFTTGPGTIAVAITVGAERPPGGAGLIAVLRRRERRGSRQRCDHLDRLSLRRSPDRADRAHGAAGHRAADGVPAHVHRRADPGDRNRRPRREMARGLSAALHRTLVGRIPSGRWA